MADTQTFLAHNLFNVRNYICVITGGGTGIGLMAAQALAANGAKVYITGRRPEALDAAATSHDPAHPGGGAILPLGPCDVTSKDDLARVVADLERREPHIHLLMCNAGIAGPKATPDHAAATPLKEKLWANESVADWQATFAADVTSVYFTTLAFLPLLQAALDHPRPSSGGGGGDGGAAEPCPRFVPSVITTSSMSGLIRHAQGHFSYNAAKAATVHLTKLMSAEFQKTGVRVNSIAPGYFPSEMTAKESDERQKSALPAEKVAEKGHVPVGRGGREEEMGMTVLFLARNEYVNGQIVAVDGGVTNVLAQ